MATSKQLKLAISLAPLLGALAYAIPAQAAPPSGGSQHHVDGGARGDFRGDFHRDHGGRGHDRFGFGFGFWDPWWGWGASDYWGPYPYYYPYYYPPYPAYYAPPAGYAPPPQVSAAPQAMGAAPPQYWYYCDNPQGYYPYVQNCGASWKQVAATQPSGSGNTITPKAKAKQ
jgi:hypothetical protein